MNAARNYPINCGQATTAEFSRAFAKRRISERSFDISVTQVLRTTASASSESITKDKTGSTEGTPLKKFTRFNSAAFVSDFRVNRTVVREGYFQGVTYSSGSTAILSDPPLSGDLAGIATHVSDGPCTLLATSRDGEVSAVSVLAISGGSAVVDEPDGWVDGSLALHCKQQIDALLAQNTQMNVFSTANGTSFVRNPLGWANGIDLSCASPWNSTGGPQRAGTLISPRHVLFCEHSSFYPSNGATMWFVSQDGQVVTRTLTSSLLAATDLRVGVLSDDVPPAINFASVLPSDWADYIPAVDAAFTVPVLMLNQAERASISNLVSLASPRFTNAFPENYQQFYGSFVSGDSGNPVFLVIDESPALIGVLTYGGAGAGFHVAQFASEVNAAMTTLGGGYQLTEIDLSEFPTY